jgi:hypothetical protein
VCLNLGGGGHSVKVQGTQVWLRHSKVDIMPKSRASQHHAAGKKKTKKNTRAADSHQNATLRQIGHKQEMLPEPALSFTLPSLHDGTKLDCRVYHPASLAATNLGAPPWQRHAAVVAHPYAPMGGCYDDPILESVAAQLLKTGYLVGTFNFRYVGRCGKDARTGRKLG